MRPIGEDRADYRMAYQRVLAGHEAELVLEDLELTYLYRQGLGEIISDMPAGANVNDWLDGAAHVVRRLKAIFLNPGLIEDIYDDDTYPPPPSGSSG